MKKAFCMFAVLTIIVCVFTGCSHSSTPETTSATISEQTAPTSSTEKQKTEFAYKMAQINEQKTVSEDEYGYLPNDDSDTDKTGTIYSALAFAIEIPSESYNSFTAHLEVYDKNGNEISELENQSYLYLYKGDILNEEELSQLNELPGFSVKEGSVILTAVYEAVGDLSFDDVEIRYVDTMDDSTYIKLEFNADISDINTFPAYMSGKGLLEVNGDYYVPSNGGEGGGGSRGEEKGYRRCSTIDFLTVSNFFSQNHTIDFDSYTFSLVDKNKQSPELPENTKLYTEVRESDNSGETTFDFGLLYPDKAMGDTIDDFWAVNNEYLSIQHNNSSSILCTTML